MQFKVPQFLDIEDKIFGPFTFKQFVYLAGGAGLCYIIYKSIGFIFGLVPILIIAGLSGALAFYRPNGKPFINMLEASFKYITQNRLYIWQKYKEEDKNNVKNKKTITQKPIQTNYRLDGNKLKDLAWSLDILDSRQKK